MVDRKNGLDGGREEQLRRRLQVLYASHTREKQIFLEDLKEYRRRKNKQTFNGIISSVGPKWYQALSVEQRTALDTLEISIHQDLLEGRPIRTALIMHKLGVVPRPQYSELMPCLALGRDDPKAMLAELYFATYGYPINGKRSSYCYNARIILSAILYLGLNNLICLLEKTFAPDVSTSPSEPKRKPKPAAKQRSPYLQKTVAVLYEPPRIRRKPPLPMPDLTELNEPYEEEPVMPKAPPPHPPPPPPKKRLPISHCEQLAGINTIKPYVSSTDTPIVKKSPRPKNRSRSRSKLQNVEASPTKKVYGIGISAQKKKTCRRKLVAPMTGLWNYQYTINGVFEVRGKTYYVLGNVTILPAQGEFIHGGYTSVNGLMINIHCGYRGWPPDMELDKCDCLKQWHDAVFRYARNTKCDCGHYYDFHNDEGHFSQEELPYFTKATRHAPLKFHYDTIYDLDSQRLYIEKTFKKIWETESLLRVDDDDTSNVIDKKTKKKKPEKDSKKDGDNVVQAEENKVESGRGYEVSKVKGVSKVKEASKVKEEGKVKGVSKVKEASKVKEESKVKEVSKVKEASTVHKEVSKVKQVRNEASQTCLGMQPKISDYLKCALRLMRKVNIAARLPDLHLVPELKEWMRQRLHGKFTYWEIKEYQRKSTTYWSMFTALEGNGFGHVSPPKEPLYGRPTSWGQKQFLNDSFKPYTDRYRLSLFKSQAYVNNLLWRTMYQAEFPDKKFREIFFSYLCSRVDDVHLIHPYCARETIERKIILMNKRYVCLPHGYEPKS